MVLTETEYEDVNWVHLAQDGYWWRTFVETEMNLRVHKSRAIKQLLVAQENYGR